MAFRPEEVSSILQKEIEKHQAHLEVESVGTILQVGDGIARIWGLEDAMMSELIQFPGDIIGMVLNLKKIQYRRQFLGRILILRKVIQSAELARLPECLLEKPLLEEL
jgi:F0F1-type ATP synthase alpha subunit